MLLDGILILALITCFITDIKQQKIYNKIIFPSLAAAVILNVWFDGLAGLKLTLLGFITGLCILLIPYFLGGMGAGDVKLLSLIGAAKGSIFVLNTAIYMALIGGVVAILVIIFQKQTINFIKTLFSWLVSFVCGIKYKLQFPKSYFSKKYPYGTAIVGGAVICLLFKRAWII
jgi:prepilin peptidase CpaA